MKVVYLQGVLMDNNEFLCCGKSIWLTKEEISKYVKDKKEISEEKQDE